MDDLIARIRAAVADWADMEQVNPSRDMYMDWGRLSAAHAKILDLHGPAVLRGGAGARYYDTRTVCVSCEPPKGVRPQSEIWPCPTVLALAEAYGIDQPEEVEVTAYAVGERQFMRPDGSIRTEPFEDGDDHG